MKRDVFCRTWYNTGEYNDNEITGPGKTIQSDYEPMPDLIKRILRGEIRQQPEVYEVDESVPDDVAFDMDDPTQSGDFDLSDIQPIMERARQASGSPIKQASAASEQLEVVEDQKKAATE